MAKRKQWRPSSWPKDLCKACPERDEDKYGMACDIACGRWSAHKNYEQGADAMLEAIEKELAPRVSLLSEVIKKLLKG